MGTSPFLFVGPIKHHRGLITNKGNQIMTRQATSIFTASTQSVGIASIPSVENLGVISSNPSDTLEIRATIGKAKGKGDNILFTFHGGSVMRSRTTKSLFLACMLRPFMYNKESKELLVNQTGAIQHSTVKSFGVAKQEVVIPENLVPIISALKAMPEEQRVLMLEIAKAQFNLSIEQLTQYMYAGSTLQHEELDVSSFLNLRFGNEGIRFKANLDKFESKIESILDKVGGGEQYSLVLRFDISRINALKEQVELQYYNEGGELVARKHPITGDSIWIQEVSIPVTYVGVEKGSTYDEDTTKFINPVATKAAMSASFKSARPEPIYMDEAILTARAEKANTWKKNLSAVSGNKFLQKSGVLDAYYNLVPQVVAGDSEALTEKLAIEESLAADSRIDEGRLASIQAKFQEKVQATSNQPEPQNKVNPVIAQEDAAIAEVVSSLNGGLDLDALLGMNLAIDAE